MIAGAYWAEREESREQAAARVADFAGRIAPLSEELAVWYAKGRSKAQALKHKLDVSSAKVVAQKLEVHRKDIGRELVPELGFLLGVWNGDRLSLSVTIGGYFAGLPNSVVLSGDDSYCVEDNVWRAVLQAMIAVFDPDGALVKDDRVARALKVSPMDIAWLTYHRGQAIVDHPERR